MFVNDTKDPQPRKKLSTNSKLLLSPTSLYFPVGASVFKEAQDGCLSVSENMLNFPVQENIALIEFSGSDLP